MATRAVSRRTAPGQTIALIRGRWLFGALGLSLVLVTLIMIDAGLTVALNQASLLFAIAGAALLLLRYRLRDGRNRMRLWLRDCAEDTFLFAAISLLGAVGSYAVAARTTGWIDEPLVRMDALIGFNWETWYRVVADHRSLQILGTAVYASIFVTPAIILYTCAASGQRAEARHFLASFWIAAVISLFLFRFLPTLGPLAYLWLGTIPYMPTSGLYQAEIIPLLRKGSDYAIDMGALRGLVGPPSFHAASAILYIAAAWRLQRFRIPVTILNIAMLCSIPVEGTHYAMDVIGGVIVALLANGLVTLWTRHRSGLVHPHSAWFRP